jgi:hypothetical protein
MRLSAKGMAFGLGLIWGGGVLFLGLIHLASPAYGASFLTGVSSIYPGFHGARSFADAILGGLYALVDGGVGGLLFAWLYNLFATRA